MTTKYTREQIDKVIMSFVDTSYEHWGFYSYAAGALQSQLTTLLADMPRHKQAQVLNVFKNLTEKYSKEKETV